ncbi:hypothetical protein BC829DRAFT_54972 [Chytridium lagenaria]|nr:hypothetical protein BC829DRAFT_54972 [Chytridium lagenaria]
MPTGAHNMVPVMPPKGITPSNSSATTNVVNTPALTTRSTSYTININASPTWATPSDAHKRFAYLPFPHTSRPKLLQASNISFCLSLLSA